jgi:precorrin-6Y C5,15-methyltransferase (decarboxylating)
VTVTVIGCDGRPPGPDAADALAEASTVIGARRHLEAAPIQETATRIELKHLDEALDTISRSPAPVVVLASGDPGFFGIVRAVRARGIAPVVIPAVSSVALAFARLGLDWDDALVLSAHGRDPRKALAAALAHPKAAILTAPGTARDLGTALRAAGKQVYIAECLGSSRERVAAFDTAAAPADPNILISLDEQPPGEQPPGQQPPGQQSPDEQPPGRPPREPRWLAGHQGAPPGWALPEDAFAHRDSMITKAEVRALVLARLGPGPGQIVWDVGAGSGSVAIECARFGAHVVAIEADQDQCERIKRNAAAHQVRVQVRHGRAPAALKDLPPADAVFAGGGDHAVLDAAIQHANPKLIVVTLAAVSRVAETAALLTAHGYQADGVQLQASRLSPLPNGQLRLAAENPVFVLWGNR